MPTKYASQKVKDYVFVPNGFEMDWDAINAMYDQPQCYLVALGDVQIAVILALFKFLKFSHLWGFQPRKTWDAATRAKWDVIENFVAEMELCLMSGCSVQDVVFAIRELTAVIGSRVVDLSQPIPNNLDFSTTGIADKLEYGGNSIARNIDALTFSVGLMHTELIAITTALGFVTNSISSINGSINESFNLDTEGGLIDNINDRLRNLNITLGGLIDGVDLIGIAESLTELNRIRNTLETTVVTQNGVQRQGVATALQENTDNIAFILDRIRDNLDVSVFDTGSQQIKEYSITSALFTRISEFIEVVDGIRDNLDAVVDIDTEMGLAAMIDALNVTSARINNSLRCVADALNATCPPGATADPPYLRSGNMEADTEDADWIAALQEIRADLINDQSEGRVPLPDETDDDFHIADGTFTLISVAHTVGQDPDTGYLLIDVTTNGKCELIFNVSGTSRTTTATFLLPQERVYMTYVPDTGTLKVLNEATGDTTSINW